MKCRFAGRRLNISYINKLHKDIGDYEVESIYVNGKEYCFEHGNPVIDRAYIMKIFKSICGISPSEYRKNQEINQRKH